MFAGSKASQVRAGCEVAKVTADELKSKPNAVLRRTSKEPTKEDIKQRVAKLDGMTVFSALKLNLPGGVGVHGGDRPARNKYKYFKSNIRRRPNIFAHVLERSFTSSSKPQMTFPFEAQHTTSFAYPC